MRDLNLVLERYNQSVTKVLESNRKVQYQQIHSLRKQIIDQWKKNESVTDVELNRIFKYLYSNINQDIKKIVSLCYKTCTTFGISEEGVKMQSEAMRIQHNCMEELEADKKKLQKLKNGWSIVLAGYEDEEDQE